MTGREFDQIRAVAQMLGAFGQLIGQGPLNEETRWYLIPLVCCLSTPASYAATFTVSPGQRIASALSQMHAGDTLTIQGGAYDEKDLHPPSGVTIQGAPGQSVVIRPTGTPASGFEFGGTHVTIRNLTLNGSAGGLKVGIWIEGSDNTIQDVTIANPTSQGIALFCAAGNHQGCGHGGNTLVNVG
jgi:hypothetical protein